MKLRVVTYLLAGLIAAAPAGAQPGGPGSGSVDTREDCVALKGAWKPAGNGWQSACEVPWSREDCLQSGGSWTQVAKAATGGRCLALQSAFGLAQQCLDRGGSWGPPAARVQGCTIVGPKPRVAAATKAPDAGKLCDSQKDCTYGCVYVGPPVAPKADVIGRCRATSIASGCYSMVDAGRLAGSVCIK